MADAALSQKDLDDLLGGGLDDSFDSSPTSSVSISGGDEASVFNGLDELLPAEDGFSGSTKSTSSAKPLTKPRSSSTVDNIDLMGNMATLKHIQVDINVELGKKILMIKDILSLGEGSIIELEKSATEYVDILVNNRLIARGEVVVVDEKFGVRITEKMNPNEMEE